MQRRQLDFSGSQRVAQDRPVSKEAVLSHCGWLECKGAGVATYRRSRAHRNEEGRLTRSPTVLWGSDTLQRSRVANGTAERVQYKTYTRRVDANRRGRSRRKAEPARPYDGGVLSMAASILGWRAGETGEAHISMSTENMDVA